MAVAAVGTFMAWHHATTRPETAYLVAARPLAPGQRLTAEDLRPVPMKLPGDVSSAAFTDAGRAVGRVVLGPVGEGELLQSALVSDPAEEVALVEVSFALPRDRAVDGRLRSGDRVDVFVTDGERTRAVLEGVLVVTAVDSGTSPMAAGGDIMVTVGLDDPAHRGDLIHAVRAGEVTLTRSTLTGFGNGDDSTSSNGENPSSTGRDRDGGGS